MIAGNAELLSAFSNPSIAHSDKENVLEGLIRRTAPSHTTANFLRVLLRNDRLTDLSEINERFAFELDERSGQISAEVLSARELADSERADLRTNLERLTGKKVNLNFGVDPNIIGGVVTRIGSKVYDGSVRTQLDNLKQELVSG
jgi:F-type H+-transporting ATPase subunit delta